MKDSHSLLSDYLGVELSCTKERVPAAVGAELRETCQHFHSARADVVEIVDMKQGHKVKCRFSVSVFSNVFSD